MRGLHDHLRPKPGGLLRVMLLRVGEVPPMQSMVVVDNRDGAHRGCEDGNGVHLIN